MSFKLEQWPTTTNERTMHSTELLRTIAEAYRWHHRLGNTVVKADHCHFIVDPSCPEVWDSNHVDEVTAQSDDEIHSVFQAMEKHLAHTRWQVVHTDCFTPDAFLARLAFEDFIERPATILMGLQHEMNGTGSMIELHRVTGDADWNSLLQLVLIDHAEGRRTSGLNVSPSVSAGIVAGYRAKSANCQYYLARLQGELVAYGMCAAAPSGVGIIDDVFTLQSARRRGIATAMIARFTEHLRSAGCETIFVGALATEQPKQLYHRLGFRPVTLVRSWVREMPRRSYDVATQIRV